MSDQVRSLSDVEIDTVAGGFKLTNVIISSGVDMREIFISSAASIDGKSDDTNSRE